MTRRRSVPFRHAERSRKGLLVGTTPTRGGTQRSRPDGNWCAKDRRGRAVPGLPCAETIPVASPAGSSARSSA